MEFTDGSKLFIRDTVINGIKRKYSYHWQDKNENLIIRWDNAPDWDVKTFPHHKHMGQERVVGASYERSLEQVLHFISQKVKAIKHAYPVNTESSDPRQSPLHQQGEVAPVVVAALAKGDDS